MYNNRIYIEKFYCTYILRITSVSTRLLRLEPDNHTLNTLNLGVHLHTSSSCGAWALSLGTVSEVCSHN